MRRRKASLPFTSRGVFDYRYGRLCPDNHPRAIAEWYANGWDKLSRRLLDLSKPANVAAPSYQARAIELE